MRFLLLLTLLACGSAPPMDARPLSYEGVLQSSFRAPFTLPNEYGQVKCWAAFEHDSHPLWVDPAQCPFRVGRHAHVEVIANEEGYREVLWVIWTEP